MKNLNKLSKTILLFVLSILFAIFISFVFSFWTGYPRGGDAMVHSLKIFWVANFFPHHNWWNVWASGMPIFLFYPIGPNLLLALLANILNFSPEMILTITAVFSIGLSGFFTGLLVYRYSRSFIASTLASFILISAPIMWVSSIISGSYIRAFALPFLVASLYFAGKLAHKPKKKVYQFATILSLVLCISTHTLIGVEAAMLVGALLVFLVPGFRQKILILIRTFLPFVLIMSFYFVPLIVFSPRASFDKMTVPAFDLDNLRFISLEYALGLFPDSTPKSLIFFNLTPFIFPLLAFLLLATLFVKREIFKQKILWFYILGAFGFIVFATVKIQFLKRFYHFIGTHGLLHFAAIFAVGAVGILIGKILGRFANFVSLCLIFLLSAFLWLTFSPNPQTWKETITIKRPGYQEDPVFSSLKSPQNSQFRLGTSLESHFAMLFNRYYPDYPQTRDYFANGVINDDFNFYLAKAVWDWGDNLDETKFLLDWWAVDKLLLREENEYFEKFANFNSTGKMWSLLIYEFSQATPILSSTNTPAVLFIGERENYMILFHALAQANINSQKIIPVFLGKDNLQGLKLSELQKFSAVFVYDAKLEDKKGQIVLKNYVEEGGSLFIESRGEISNLTEPFPFRSMKKDKVVGIWNLVQEDYDFGVNMEVFSPPVFEEGSWGVSTAKGLYPWAQVLIGESGEPIIVGGKLGEGKVVWSGMNLLYHAASYKNKEETLLVKGIFDWLQDGKEISGADFEVEFVHPEKRVIDLKDKADGVLFKEAYFPKWHAYLESENKKQKIEIYKAGPDFMYVPLSGIKIDDKVIFEYKISIVEIIAYIISLSTFIGLILWLFDWWIFKPWMALLVQKITSPRERLLEWWRSEEE